VTSTPGRKHSAGGKVSIPLPFHVKGQAVFGGKNDEYRYRLHRTWGPGKRVLFMMMNPSTADPTSDDSTVYKCRKYAVAWALKAWMLTTRLLTKLLIKRFFARWLILSDLTTISIF
jgi:hypothetical protein